MKSIFRNIFDIRLLFWRSKLPASINGRLLLAERYNERVHDPTGWWMSEKFDGFRAFWDGSNLYTRHGILIRAPLFFTEDLPRNMFLDGELIYNGGHRSNKTFRLMRSPQNYLWKCTKYHVFDCPHIGSEPFEKRMSLLKKYFENSKPKNAKLVEQNNCKGKEHLRQELNRIASLDKEGLMLRQPESIYETCRSKTLLKVKKVYSAEAVVLKHKIDDEGRCSFLLCRMAKGTMFPLFTGLTNKDRLYPPKIGSVIKFNFYKYSNHRAPVFPSFKGVCADKTNPSREIKDITYAHAI